MDGKAYADMIIADIRSGKIDNFAPLIALFKMAGKHLTLDERIQLSPFLNFAHRNKRQSCADGRSQSHGLLRNAVF